MTDNTPPQTADTPPPELREPPDTADLPETPDTAQTPASPSISDDLLEILVCPLTRSKLRQEGNWLVATAPINAGLRYPIRNGIPVLLVDSAEMPAGVADLGEFKRKYADAIP